MVLSAYRRRRPDSHPDAMIKLTSNATARRRYYMKLNKIIKGNRERKQKLKKMLGSLFTHISIHPRNKKNIREV